MALIKPSVSGRNSYRAALRLQRFNKRLERVHSQIDKREERKDFDLDYHTGENETGRVWSF